MILLVLPGLDGTGYLHGDCTGLLSEHFDVRVLTYPVDVQDHAQALAFVQTVLPDEDFVIVAESFSGPVAVMLAAAAPVGLRGVVFVASFASAPRHLPRALLALINLWPFQWRITAWLAQPMVLGRWGTGALRSALRKGLADVPKATIINRIAAVMQVDVREQLADIAVPHLYLQATHDRLVPRRATAPFGKVQQITGPHFLMQANPDDCAAAITGFCKTL